VIDDSLVPPDVSIVLGVVRGASGAKVVVGIIWDDVDFFDPDDERKFRTLPLMRYPKRNSKRKKMIGTIGTPPRFSGSDKR